jgi:hypothetical protein
VDGQAVTAKGQKTAAAFADNPFTPISNDRTRLCNTNRNLFNTHLPKQSFPNNQKNLKDHVIH